MCASWWSSPWPPSPAMPWTSCMSASPVVARAGRPVVGWAPSVPAAPATWLLGHGSSSWSMIWSAVTGLATGESGIVLMNSIDFVQAAGSMAPQPLASV